MLITQNTLGRIQDNSVYCLMPTSPKQRVRPWESKQERKPHQGRAERTPEYSTSRWQKARLAYLQQHPLCLHCQEEGIVTAATVLDHKQQVRAGADFWNRDNWQGLCKHHHAVKSALERHGK